MGQKQSPVSRVAQSQTHMDAGLWQSYLSSRRADGSPTLRTQTCQLAAGMPDHICSAIGDVSRGLDIGLFDIEGDTSVSFKTPTIYQMILSLKEPVVPRSASFAWTTRTESLLRRCHDNMTHLQKHGIIFGHKHTSIRADNYSCSSTPQCLDVG